MPVLYKTTTSGKPKHPHYLFVVDETLADGKASLRLTSTESHEHDLEVLESEIEVNEGLGKPAADLSLVVILPAPDGHTHHLKLQNPMIPSEFIEIPSDKESDVKHKLRRQFYNAKEREKNSKANGIENERMYKGDQWFHLSQEELDKKIKEKKPMLVFNEIQKFVKLIVGYMRQKRTDTKFMPVEGSDSMIADIYTALYKIDSGNSNYEVHESQVVRDQCLTGRGNFWMYVDKDEDVRGEIKFEKTRWQQMYYGEHDMPDASDCPYIQQSIWMTEDKLKNKFPKFKEEIRETIDLLKTLNDDDRERDDKTDKGMLLFEREGATKDYFDNTNNSYNVLECWERRYFPINTVYSLDEEMKFEYNSPTGFGEEDTKQLETIGLSVVARNKKYIKHYILIGADLLVLDEIYPFNNLPIFPVYFDRVGDEILSFVDSAKDPQFELNKRVSTVSDILNKTPFKTRFFDQEIFDNTAQLDFFKEHANDPDALIQVKDITRLPVESTSSIFPAQIVQYGEFMRGLGADLININFELQGAPSDAKSGIAILRRQMQALMGNENIPDNLNFTKRQMARTYVEMAHQTYTPGRVIAILEDNLQKEENLEAGITLGGKTFKNQFTQEEKIEIMERWQNQKAAKYDVAVTQSPYNATTMMANFLLVAELVNSGQLPMPVLAMLEIMPFPYREKKKLKAIVLESERRQLEIEQNKQNVEIEKGKNANQGKLLVKVLDVLSKKADRESEPADRSP